jgi:hypothetical protein
MIPVSWLTRFARSLLALGGRISRSEIGLLVAVLHAGLFVIAVANMGPADPVRAAGLQQQIQSGGWSSGTYFAGRAFHYYYESLLLKTVLLLDLPMSFVAMQVTWPLWSSFTYLGLYAQSYVAAGLTLLAASVQWFIVGHAMQVWFARRPGRRQRSVAWLARHTRHAVIAILVVTVIVVPLVHQTAVARFERAIRGGRY